MRKILLILISFFVINNYSFADVSLNQNQNIEIQHLFDYLNKSGCEFNRNGSWYSAKDAVAHLSKKYKYLQDKKAIKTTEDFIKYGASQSSITGSAYLVKCGNNKELNSNVWFNKELAEFRNSINKKI
jgi:Family of unknown function (DUF5329)